MMELVALLKVAGLLWGARELRKHEPTYGSREWAHEVARAICRQHGVLEQFEAYEQQGKITPVEEAVWRAIPRQ